jgi:hypothetical protein
MKDKKSKSEKRARELLCRSFDADLDEHERTLLEEALAKSEALRDEQRFLSAQRRALSESAAKSFGPFFAERVIGRIREMENRKNAFFSIYETLMRIFPKYAFAGAVILLALILYNLSLGDHISAEEIFYASDMTLENIKNLPLF